MDKLPTTRTYSTTCLMHPDTTRRQSMWWLYCRKSLWVLCSQLAVAIASLSQQHAPSQLHLSPDSYVWMSDSRTSDPTGDGSRGHTLPEIPKPNFQLAPAVRQAMFYTGVMHAFRYGTQIETRSATYGPFIPRYLDSVRELRGWDDSDSFTTSYILHPMEGSVFGYIQQQNDPRYKTTEWGSGRDYWISRLRALAFSAASSTQWSIGPFSEASLANVQLHDSPGFVDIVATPTLGVVWMMGEDLLDRYAVIAVENRTSNPLFLLLARSCFTPTRAFANMMALKVPWHRDTRPGFFGKNRALRS